MTDDTRQERSPADRARRVQAFAAALAEQAEIPEFTSFKHALWHLDEMAAHHGLDIMAGKIPHVKVEM